MSELTDVLLACENQLGWQPPRDKAPWQIRKIELGKLKRAMGTRGYTVDDVRLALTWCLRRRQPIDAPVQLLNYVEAARALAAPNSAPDPLAEQVEHAVSWEMARDDEHSQPWITRLVRATGRTRAAALADWREAGRG